jgi:uncharacterized protein YqeY
MLEKLIRIKVLSAINKGDNLEKNVLRFALGELERETSLKNLTEEDKQKIIKRLIKSNENTLKLTESEDDKYILKEEIDIFKSILPKELDKKDIEVFVKKCLDVGSLTLDYDNVGKSVGIVMKTFKKSNIAVDGKLVKEVVSEILDF